MGNKFVDKSLAILLWVVVVAVIASVIGMILQPIIFWTDKSEWRLYVRVGLLLLAVIAFGVLRLYNSTVQNTRVAFKVQQYLDRILSHLPQLQNSMRTLGLKEDGLRGVVSSNTKAVEGLSQDAREVLTALKQKHHNNGQSTKNPA